MNSYEHQKNTSYVLNAGLLLHSFEEFCIWFLKRHDYEMFDVNDIDALLEEVKPKCYPCVPLELENGYEFIYITPAQIKMLSDLLENDQC